MVISVYRDMKRYALIISITLIGTSGCLGPFANPSTIASVWLSNETGTDFSYIFVSPYSSQDPTKLGPTEFSIVTVFKREKSDKGLPGYMERLKLVGNGCEILLDRKEIVDATKETEPHSFLITINSQHFNEKECSGISN